MTTAGEMRAWRTHQYGPPLEALMLDVVPIPDPGPGELRIKVDAVPLNLNDLERITGPYMIEKWLKAGPILQCPNADCKHKQPLPQPAPAPAA